MGNDLIISLHVPKTAGTSFLAALSEKYGRGLETDYKGAIFGKWGIVNQTISPENIPAAVQCIHGHFEARRYRLFNHAGFIAWIRDPVERVASHYYYWKKTSTAQSPGLRGQVIRENWTLKDFCLSAEMKNFYTNRIFKDFDMVRFKFIGITERYAQDLKVLSDILGGKPLKNIQRNIAVSIDYQHIADQGLRQEIKEFHGSDMDFYEKYRAIQPD